MLISANTCRFLFLDTLSDCSPLNNISSLSQRRLINSLCSRGLPLIVMELSLVLHALFVFLLFFPILMATCDTISLKGNTDMESSPFPSNFLFGTASSSYQVFLPFKYHLRIRLF